MNLRIENNQVIYSGNVCNDYVITKSYKGTIQKWVGMVEQFLSQSYGSVSRESIKDYLGHYDINGTFVFDKMKYDILVDILILNKGCYGKN
jgi:hypothetical protein